MTFELSKLKFHKVKAQNKAYIFALIAVFFWSTVATAFKIALRGVDVFQLIFFTSLFSTLILLLTIIVQKKIKLIHKIGKKNIIKSMTLGIINPFFYYTILFSAYSLLPAQEAMVLNYTWPIMLVLLSIPLLKQRIKLKSLIAVIISFIGILIVITKGSFSNLILSNLKGDILALGSSIIWALFWILNLKDKNDEVIKLFLNFLSGTILSAIVLFKMKGLPEIKFEIILPLIYIGAFEMSITFIFWLKALKLSESTDKVSQLIFISPVFSLLIINIILKEQISFYTFLGLIFIILGIIMQQSSFRFSNKKKV